MLRGTHRVLLKAPHSFLKCLKMYSCLFRFSYLQKHTAEHIVNLREDCWQPLIYYRASLLAVAEGEDAVSYVSSDRKPKQKLDGTTLNSLIKVFYELVFTKHQLHHVYLFCYLGSKSPCPFSPVDSKVSKVHRPSFSPRWDSSFIFSSLFIKKIFIVL